MGKQLEDAFRQAILGPASAGVLSPTQDRKSYGPYEVVASIGRGGMGEIYLARRTDTGRDVRFVALKVLSDEVEGDDEIIAMFIDEASIMAQIDHPNVLRVFDFGVEGSSHYLSMEYLAGRPLVRVMIDAYAGGRGLSYAAVAAIGIGAARGLDAAHRARTKAGAPLDVIHRDISPQNLFITYDGTAKVIDFGVARASERMAKTVAGQLKGKAAYMSPEQVTGKEIDQRTDIFSLGACLWEMAAGRRLFRRQTDFDTMVAVTEGAIVSPTGLRGDLDRDLDFVVLGALARDREKRTQNAADLERNLTAYAERRRYPTDGSALAQLMGALYGKESRAEAGLIAGFRERFATEAEVEALRALSGISPRPVHAELTIMGAGLEELDDFGSSTEAGPAAPARVPQSNRAAASDDDEVRTVTYDASAHLEKFGAESTDEELEDEGLATLTPDAGLPPLLRSKDPSNASAEREGDATMLAPRPPSAAPSATIREDEDTADDDPTAGQVALPLKALEAQVAARARTLDKVAVEARTEVGGRSIAKLSVLGVVSLAIGVGIAYLVMTRRPPPLPSPPAPTEGVTPEAPKPVAPVAVATTIDDVLLRVSADVGAEVDGSKRTLRDKQGGVLVVGVDSTLRAVKSGTAEGWIVSSTSNTSAKVGWIGTVRGSPWRVRPLSVNDCSASVKPGQGSIELTYPEKTLVLPEGGGALRTISFERPAFAQRLELKTLGLAFGRDDPARPGELCGRGFVKDRVVISRLPPGDFAFVWVGKDAKDQPQTASVTVTVPPDGPETIEVAAAKHAK
ncbi:MAG: serine/threonine protein kinase [Deltaproteobacteria bacterium]|nr:serine/threonine protein kinase [Deltaproteobacteria bacterium]